jgi:hypothetical protein
MLREGAASKLEALLEAQRGALRVVVPLRTGQSNGKVAGWRQVARGRKRRGTD